MTEPGDSDSAPQRKRIAVACLRCRKRKIRCSGDPGTGLPCINCKNAGIDSCQFLRVQSHEASMRPGPGEYQYQMDDARMYAPRQPAPTSVGYTNGLPGLGSNDMLTYRSGPSYPSYPSRSSYYNPPIAEYSQTPYANEYYVDGNITGYGSQPVLAAESPPVNIVPSQMTSRPSSHMYHSGMYAESDTGYYGKTTTLAHRPAMGADHGQYPAASTLSSNSSDRLLPIPAGRSSLGGGVPTLPYAKSSTATANSTPNSTPSPIVPSNDGTAAPGYGPSSYDLPFPPPGTTLASHRHHHTHAARTGSDTYSSGGEAIFGDHDHDHDHDHGLASQGPALDLGGYTYGVSRRGSSGSGSHAAGILSNGHAYVPSDSSHGPAVGTGASGGPSHHSSLHCSGAAPGRHSRSHHRARAGSNAPVDGHSSSAGTRR